MRNLKRVLSLALALVMMLGMMIVGASAASADFPDAEEINYTEAVDVLTGLGVLEGDEKGSFNPTDILTRAQAAKIICYTIMGPENAAKLGKNATIFKDVPATHWAAGYISYCTNLGILAGYGDGTFGPEDQLTGVAFGKLLLVAAGYDAEAQGYVGNDWALNIGTDMISNGLDIKGVVMSNPLTREQAAQMVLQALEMDTVTYTKGTVIGLVGPYAVEIRNEGTANYAGSNRTDDGYGTQQFCEKYFAGLKKIDGTITDTLASKGQTTLGTVKLSNTAADWTDVGYAAYAWVTGLKANTAKALSVVVTGVDLSVTTNGTVIANGKTGLTDDLKSNDNYVADLDDNVVYYLNGEAMSGHSAVDAESAKIGAKIALVDNDKDGDIDSVIATSYTAARVERVQEKSTSGTITTAYYALNNGVNIEPKNLKGVDALVKGDYITYVVVDGDYYVTVVDSAIGEFESITRTKLNGTNVKTYNIDGEGYIGSEMANVDYTYLTTSHINDNVIYVLDEYGYLIFADEYKDPDAYLYVLGNEHNMSLTGLAETEVAYADGKVEIVDVKAKTVADGLAEEIYSYTVKNGAYTLTKETDGVLTDVTYNTDEVTMGNVALTKYTTIVDLRDVIAGKADEGTVYVGWNEIPSVVGGKVVYLENSAGKMDLGFLVAGKDPNKLAASFVVFDTTFNTVDRVKVGGVWTYTYELEEGVLVKGELKTNYVLSQAQKDAIDTYGVGVYTFDNDENLTGYVSFAEDSVKWEPRNYGTIIKDNVDITDDYKTIILNITDGEVDDWELLVKNGDYFAYIDKKNDVLYIVGDATTTATGTDSILAPKSGDGVVFGANKYWAKDAYVTNYEVVPAATYPTTAPAIYKAEAGDIAWTATNSTTFTATVPYATWKNWTGTYTVDPADGNEIAIDQMTTFTTENLAVAVDTTGATQTITVLSQGNQAGAVTTTYTFTITYTAGNTDNVLRYQGTPVNTASTYGGNATTIPNLKVLYTGGVKRDWTFYDGNGDLIANEADLHDTAAVGFATVVVTSETGAEAVYVVLFSAATMDQDIVATVIDAMLDASYDVEDIVDALYDGGIAPSGNDVLAVLADADANPIEVMEAWTTFGDEIVVANAMKNNGFEAQDVVNAYLALLAETEFDVGLASGDYLDNIEVTANGNQLTLALVVNDADDYTFNAGQLINMIMTTWSYGTDSVTVADDLGNTGTTNIAGIVANGYFDIWAENIAGGAAGKYTITYEFTDGTDTLSIVLEMVKK